jgi:broad specificity phosphatase PhoE
MYYLVHFRSLEHRHRRHQPPGPTMPQLHPANPMLLHLARHGETELNREGDRYQGRTDPPLNATGLAQAQALAAALPAGIEVIVASPLQRARQTADAVAQARGLPVSLMPEFRERDFGDFEGLRPQDVQDRHPQAWADNLLWQWDTAPPNAETTRQVVQRVAAGLATLEQLHAGRTVLLVCHGFVVRSLRFLLDGLEESQFFQQPKIGNGQFITYPQLAPPAPRR